MSVVALSNELTGRALPRVAEFTDSLNVIIKNAESGGPASPGSKEILRRLYDALARGQQAMSPIEIVRR
jgi:hypothetical protein